MILKKIIALYTGMIAFHGASPAALYNSSSQKMNDLNYKAKMIH